MSNGGICGALVIESFAFKCSLTLGHHDAHWNSDLAHIINQHQKPPREILTVGGLRSALKGIHPDCIVEVNIGGDGYGDGISCEFDAENGGFGIFVEPYETEAEPPTPVVYEPPDTSHERPPHPPYCDVPTCPWCYPTIDRK